MYADAGLRVVGKFEGSSCYCFVTRFGGRYTVVIFERRPGRQGKLGRRLAVLELNGIGELKSLIRMLVPGRVRAFSY